MSRLDITQAETIFNAAFPSAIRYDDSHERFMYYGRHNSIPQDDWEEASVDLPELEVVTMEIFNAMSQAMTLPLQILSVGYIGAMAGDQHWHRDWPKNLVPNGDRVCGVFIPLTYPLNNTWIPGSSTGFPVPWEEQVMEAALGDAFILDALLVVDVHKTSLPLILCLKCPTFVGLHLCMLPHAGLRRMSPKASAPLFGPRNPGFKKVTRWKRV